MKRLACAWPLLAGIPSVLSAQVSLSFPRLQRPVVRAALGPVSILATLNSRGVTVHAIPKTTPSSPARGAPAATSTTAASVLATAKRYVGIHYRYGGESPTTGFDCSGFVQYVFRKQGVELPRTSRLQAHAGTALPLDVGALQPGDLLLFASTGHEVNHVAIYVGNNRMLHSSAGAGGVVYEDLTTPRGRWYLERHVASRRVL
jgi:cell wall-associated NlpC family hydrolase